MTIGWQDARDKVRGDLWRLGTTGVPDDVCDRALHASLLDIEAERRWLWLEDIASTIPIAERANKIVSPSSYRAFTSVSVVSPEGVVDDPLAIMPVALIRVLQSQGTIGWPQGYANSGGWIYLDSSLDVGFSIEIIGTLKTPDVIEDAISAAETNVTLQSQQTAVIAGAAAHVSLSYRKDEAEAARQTAVRNRIVERLKDADDDARSDLFGGCVLPDTYYRDLAG
jgi:hypothetical protein